MGFSNWVHLDVDRIVAETDAAFLLLVDDEEIWFPKSQIDSPESYEVGDEDCTVSVTEWIARQKGIET